MPAHKKEVGYVMSRTAGLGRSLNRLSVRDVQDGGIRSVLEDITTKKILNLVKRLIRACPVLSLIILFIFFFRSLGPGIYAYTPTYAERKVVPGLSRAYPSIYIV